MFFLLVSAVVQSVRFCKAIALAVNAWASLSVVPKYEKRLHVAFSNHISLWNHQEVIHAPNTNDTVLLVQNLYENNILNVIYLYTKNNSCIELLRCNYAMHTKFVHKSLFYLLFFLFVEIFSLLLDNLLLLYLEISRSTFNTQIVGKPLYY